MEKIVAPTTFVVALAYYFGRQFTHARSAYFGLDASVLGFSTQDYVVRSADALFIPLGTVGVIGLVCVESHQLVRRNLGQPRLRSIAERLPMFFTTTGVILLTLGSYAAFRPLPINVHYLIPPLSPAVGVLLIAYGAHLGSLLRGKTDLHEDERASSALSATRRLLVAAVVVMSLFWAASDYAGALGRGRAQSLAGALARQPGTIVFSRNRLLFSGPGMRERSLATGAFYRYRYDGLRLLIRSGERFFMLPEGWTRQHGTVIVLRDTSDVRVEFLPALR